MLDEEEFREANEMRRDDRTRLTGRQTELTEWLVRQHERQEAVGTLPTRVRSGTQRWIARSRTVGRLWERLSATNSSRWLPRGGMYVVAFPVL